MAYLPELIGNVLPCLMIHNCVHSEMALSTAEGFMGRLFTVHRKPRAHPMRPFSRVPGYGILPSVILGAFRTLETGKT